MQEGDVTSCNLPSNCVIEEARFEAQLPDVKQRSTRSPFDGSRTWSCDEEAHYWVELDQSKHGGPAERFCETHARATQWLADKGLVTLVRIWDRRTGKTVQLATHLIQEEPV